MRLLPCLLAALLVPSVALAEPLPPPQPPPAPFWTGPRIAASILVGTGIGAIVAGVVYAARSDAANAATKAHCLTSDPDACDPEGYRLRRQSTADGQIATTALGVGAAGVFLGLVLAWVNPELHPRTTPAKVSVAPVLNGEQRGIVVIGRF
jgi:hypothetical protein